MRTVIVILCILTVAIALFGVLRFWLGGGEDTWLCRDGAWVKHGNPSASAPADGCTPTPIPEEGVMCTQDAKLCPDGSYVGRTGPRCEFAPCP